MELVAGGCADDNVSSRVVGEVVVLLVSLGVVEGAPAVDRDLLTNQVCQFQVTNMVRAMGVMKVFTICNPEKNYQVDKDGGYHQIMCRRADICG